MATLLFKVFTLTMKTVSKPLASRFESYVMGHPVLRQRVIHIAQMLHRTDVSLSRNAEGRTGRVFVGDISEEKAVQLASKVASEGFVYMTAIVLLLLEMQRKNHEDAEKKKKAEAEKQEIQRLHHLHQENEVKLLDQQIQMRHMMERMEERLVALEEQYHRRTAWGMMLPWGRRGGDGQHGNRQEMAQSEL